MEELELNILEDEAPKFPSVRQASLSSVKKITFASMVEEELSQELRDHGTPEILTKLAVPEKTISVSLGSSDYDETTESSSDDNDEFEEDDIDSVSEDEGEVIEESNKPIKTPITSTQGSPRTPGRRRSARLHAQAAPNDPVKTLEAEIKQLKEDLALASNNEAGYYEVKIQALEAKLSNIKS